MNRTHTQRQADNHTQTQTHTRTQSDPLAKWKERLKATKAADSLKETEAEEPPLGAAWIWQQLVKCKDCKRERGRERGGEGEAVPHVCVAQSSWERERDGDACNQSEWSDTCWDPSTSGWAQQRLQKQQKRKWKREWERKCCRAGEKNSNSYLKIKAAHRQEIYNLPWKEITNTQRERERKRENSLHKWNKVESRQGQARKIFKSIFKVLAKHLIFMQFQIIRYN